MKKTKTKAKSKAKKQVSIYSRSFSGSNSVKMLAAVLMLIIFADGMMFGLIGAGDVNAGLQVLDMSGAVHQTVSDVSAMTQPLIDVAASVNQFYEMAATQTMFLLDDNIITNIGALFTDVQSFYQIASREMASALDLSNELYPPSVAYASY